MIDHVPVQTSWIRPPNQAAIRRQKSFSNPANQNDPLVKGGCQLSKRAENDQSDLTKNAAHDTDAVVYRRNHPYEPPFVLLLATVFCSLFALVGNSLHTQAIALNQDGLNLTLKTCLTLLTLLFLHLIIRRRTHDSLASCILLLASSYTTQEAWRSIDQSIALTLFAMLLWILDRAFASYMNYKGELAPNQKTDLRWLSCVMPTIATWWFLQSDYFVGMVASTCVMMGTTFAVHLSNTRAQNFVTTLVWIVSASLLLAVGLPFAQLSLLSTSYLMLMIASILVSRKEKNLAESLTSLLLVALYLTQFTSPAYLIIALTAWTSPHLRNACRQIQSWVTDLWQRRQTRSPANRLETWTKSSIATHAFVRNNRWLHVLLAAVCYWFAVLVLFSFFN